jgi:ribosome-associated protein
MDLIADPEEVTAHLLARADFTATRSSGAGGQHRDKASTRAELALGEDALEGLPDHVAAALRTGLGLDRRGLRIEVEEERYLSRNREIAEERLRALVAEALTPPPPPRRRTRPSASARAARVGDKRQRSTVKKLRRPPDLEH